MRIDRRDEDRVAVRTMAGAAVGFDVIFLFHPDAAAAVAAVRG